MNKVLHLLLVIYFSIGCFQTNAQQNEIINRPIEEIIKPFGESSLFSGTLLVAKNGEVIFKKAYGSEDLENDKQNSIHTKFILGPTTQIFTSVLIFKMIDEGSLSLDSKLSEFFTGLPDQLSQVAIKHLLNHTSGIQNYYQMEGWSEGKFDQGISDDDFINVIEQMPLLFDPGTNYFYSNAGYFLLAKIIEKVSGKVYKQVLNDLILQPLEMENTGIVENMGEISDLSFGYFLSSEGLKKQPDLNLALFKGTGNIYSTVDDFYKLDSALYTDQLLSELSKSILFDPSNNYGWKTKNFTITGHTGELMLHESSGETDSYSSLITRFPNERHTIILLGNTGTGQLVKEKIVGEISKLLYDIPILDSKKDVMPLIAKSLLRGDLDATIKRIVSVNYLFDAEEKLISEFGNQLSWYGRTNDAIKVFELNAQLFPKSSGALFQLAEKYKENNQLDKAIPVYEKVLDFYPNNTYILNIINQNSP
ncbi:serine hydrolase [Sunxiuqinia sp. A32]|uniref:serine hydrolase n=1 Tax=Sunxiuqinia sp. A32 TaxID=3461496 RepID=UPI00404578A6